VKINWYTESGFYDQTGTIGLSHPQHPATRLDRTMISVMERAVADVLYAAGFTVILRPGIDNTDPLKVRDPEVIVAAGPEFKAWTVLDARAARPAAPRMSRARVGISSGACGGAGQGCRAAFR
jgi:hypothetical protein